MITDWCAVCEKPLVLLPHGAYAECHDGRAYWSTFHPNPRDETFPLAPVHVARGSVTGARVRMYFRAKSDRRVI